MPACPYVLRCASRVFALGLALALVLGSLCPRGWFICVHPGQIALVDEQHAAGAGECAEHTCCVDGKTETKAETKAERKTETPTGCLDYAVSLVFDDQLMVPSLTLTHLTGGMMAALPGLSDTSNDTVRRFGAAAEPDHSPPGTIFLRHIRLLV